MNPPSEFRTKAHNLRARLREATNEAILAAAEEVFGAEGLHGAKVEAIAAQAGVAVGTLYNHFGDRERLLEALVEARRTDLLSRLDDALARSKGRPFPEQLRTFLRALTGYLEAHKPFLAILWEVEASRDCRTYPVAVPKQKRIQHTEEIFRRVHLLAERGLRARVLGPEDAETYAALLMGMIRGFMVRRLVYQRAPALTDRVDLMVEFFLHGAGA